MLAAKFAFSGTVVQHFQSSARVGRCFGSGRYQSANQNRPCSPLLTSAPILCGSWVQIPPETFFSLSFSIVTPFSSCFFLSSFFLSFFLLLFSFPFFLLFFLVLRFSLFSLFLFYSFFSSLSSFSSFYISFFVLSFAFFLFTLSPPFPLVFPLFSPLFCIMVG